MNKLTGVTLALVTMAMMLQTGLAAIDTKLSGEFWGRWTNETTKNKDNNNEYVDKVSKNYISLERGYIGLETTFTPNTKARFTVDLFSSDATYQYPNPVDVALPVDTLSTPKNASIDGAGLKLKYGYVEFGNLFPVPEMYLTVGLQKTYFGTIYDWNYVTVEKAPTDLYKVVNSSDYGLTLNGYIPEGWGEYAVGIYNGEGYKKVASSLKDNTDFAYLANLRLTPIQGVTVGGSYMMNTVERDKKLSGDAANKAYEEQALMDAVTRLAYGPMDFWFEYINKDVKLPNDTNKDYTATGLMFMPIVNLQSLLDVNIDLLARYDIWDESDKPAADKSRSLLNTLIVGGNYNFLEDASGSPQMVLQLNYTNKTYDEKKSHSDFADGKKDSSQINLQLKWKFSNTISN